MRSYFLIVLDRSKSNIIKPYSWRFYREVRRMVPSKNICLYWRSLFKRKKTNTKPISSGYVKDIWWKDQDKNFASFSSLTLLLPVSLTRCWNKSCPNASKVAQKEFFYFKVMFFRILQKGNKNLCYFCKIICCKNFKKLLILVTLLSASNWCFRS